MITLDASKVKTTTITLGEVTTTVVVDHVWMDSISANRNGNVQVVLCFGTKDVNGNPVETDTRLSVWVNRDGSFSSDDPKYQGQLDPAVVAAMLNGVFTQFEQAIVNLGWTAGTVI